MQISNLFHIWTRPDPIRQYSILFDFYSCFNIYFTILCHLRWKKKNSEMGHANNTVAAKQTWQANNFGRPYAGGDLTRTLLSDTVLKESFQPLTISVRDHHEILFFFWWKCDRDSPEVASRCSDHQIFIKRKERMFWPLLAGGRMISLRQNYQSTYRLALIRINPLMSSSAGEVCRVCSGSHACMRPCMCVYIHSCVCVWVRARLCFGCHPEGYLHGGSIVRWQTFPMMPSETSKCPSNQGSPDDQNSTTQHTRTHTCTRSHIGHAHKTQCPLVEGERYIYANVCVFVSVCAPEGLLRLW